MLIAVILVLYLSYRCSRYIASRSGCVPMGQQTGGGMKVLSRLPLAQDKQLVLVEAGGRYWLLGVSPAGIQLVAELTEDQAGTYKMQDPQEKNLNFVDILKKGFSEQKKCNT